MSHDETGGWTPLQDALVAELGLLSAAVFGLVWRYCQMREGVCRASYDTLARRLGVSRRTVIRHIRLLIAAGYLRDLTPTDPNHPHILADTGRARMLKPQRPPVTESHPASNGSSRRGNESHGGGAEEAPAAVTESHPNQTLLRDSPGNNEGGRYLAQKIWADIFGFLASEMNRADFQTWLQPAVPLEWDGRVLTVASANSFARDWLVSRLKKTIDRFLAGRVDDPQAEVRFIVEYHPPDFG